MSKADRAPWESRSPISSMHHVRLVSSASLPRLPLFFSLLSRPFSSHMDYAAGPCTAHASEQQQEPDGLAPKRPPDSPLSPVTSSACTENDGSMATAPEDGDEVWSDAQEITEADEDAGTTQQKPEETSRTFDDGANVNSAISGLKPELDETILADEDNKGSSEVIEVEAPPSIVRPVDSTGRAPVATAGHPSRETSSMPSSPTASSSMHASASLDVPSSSTSARAVSPSPTQSSHGLDRRQSRRRSTIDVCFFTLSYIFVHIINMRCSSSSCNSFY